jgi:iron(III) transport system permease protein
LGRGKEVKVKHLPRIDSKFIVIALSVLVLLYFIVFPMLILIYDSFVVDGAINFSNYKAVYSQNVNWKALVNTVELSLLVMVASVIITFPMAWLDRPY